MNKYKQRRVVFAVICLLVLTLTSINHVSAASADTPVNFYGAGTNSSYNIEFTIDITLTLHSDNTVTGALDSTGLPDGRVICGAGDLTGTKKGRTIEFTYTSLDTDPGCGFDHGNVNSFTIELSPDGKTLSGGYTSDTGQQGIVRAFSQDSWPDMGPLQEDYNSKIGTNEAAYAKQMLCIATVSCEDFEQNGSTGWANGFVRHLFSQLLQGDGTPPSLGVNCYEWLPNSVCFTLAGEYHYQFELRPGFLSYCFGSTDVINYEQWDSDHELFLEKAIKPCLDELAAAGELPLAYTELAKVVVPLRVGLLRETVQAVCSSVNDVSLSSVTLNERGYPELPDPPTQAELYDPHLADGASLQIDAGEAFFLSVGTELQLRVTPIDNPVLDITSADTEYFLNVGKEIATVTQEGLLSIHSTSSPVTSLPPVLYVVVRNGDDWGIRQFAITDVDTDGDLIVDSYERNAGLNPNRANPIDSDRDDDLLTDLSETLFGTNPIDRDTDDDGFRDGFEVYTGANPLDDTCNPFEGCLVPPKTVFLPLTYK